MRIISQFFREDLGRIPAAEREFHFVLRPLFDLHELLGDPDDHLATPVELHVRDGGVGEGVLGYAVLEGEWSRQLVQALQLYVHEETRSALDQMAGIRPDQKRRSQVRDSLAKEVDRCLESCTYSSQGRFVSSIFWLYLSLYTSRELSRIPGSLLDAHRELDRRKAHQVKFQVLQRLSTLLSEVNLEVNRRIVGEVGKRRGEFLTKLILHMRDNTLIFAEDQLDPQLTRLSSWLEGAMGLDSKRFLKKLQSTREFAESLVGKDPVVAQVVEQLVPDADTADGRRLFLDGRLAEVVFRHRRYSRRRFFNAREQEVFRDLSRRVRLFELLDFLRHRILRARERPDGLLQAKTRERTLVFSRDTAPVDFSKPGAMENVVYRYGLLYDIRNFTATLERLRRAGLQKEKTAIKHMFVFHELLFEIQQEHHLSLEKFLGDGAFYTGISAGQLLTAAVDMQHLYAALRRKGFVFDEGIRIALNHHYYNLLPIRGAGSGPGDEYALEFHGPGLVELNRLTTGKTTTELGDMKEMLLDYGYDEKDVHRFFAPMERNVAIEHEHDRPDGGAGAWLDAWGTLYNDGIVASRAFVEHLSEDLGRNPTLQIQKVRGHSYTGWTLEGRFYGIRELGTARLKGLEPQRIYEIESLEGSAAGEGQQMESRTLLNAIEYEFQKQRARQRES